MSEQSSDEDVRERLIRLLIADKWKAHLTFFAHRHQHDGRQVEPAPFHEELTADFWSADQFSQRAAFRGSGKSTLGEEDIALAIELRLYHNILIIGSNETRAADRLNAVAYELANNEFLVRLFGDAKASAQTWTQTKLILWDGRYTVQAMGRDQDIRGIKHLDYRPDFVFVDDFESPGNVQTPDQRIKTFRWFLGELLPACSPGVKVRVRYTPMDAESVPMRLEKEAGWPTKSYPIMYLDEEGKEAASWPDAFDLKWIANRRAYYAATGELGVWDREFMCQAVSDSDTPFKREMIRVAPRVKSWHACYAMIDPARTTHATSAATGWAVWSWISNRLVVWAADAQFLLPDEIVALAFDIHERFNPVWIGVELDGLEEFLLQPMRHEMVKRGIAIPVIGKRAPHSKLDFIKGSLQPFFAARECEFAQPLPALTEQLLNFPRGRIDAPNALAYSSQMRPGLPLYENFGADHIHGDLAHDHTKPLFLAANATGAMTTAMLVQQADGRLMVLADWVREGNPTEQVPYIYSEAILAAESLRAGIQPRSRDWTEMLKGVAPLPYTRRQAPTWVCPPHHTEKYTNVGLLQAIRAIPADHRLGGEAARGQIQLRDLLGRITGGMPALAVSANARWTCRAFTGGYSRSLVRGRLQDTPEEGPYRLLMEGLESFAALSRLDRSEEAEDTEQPWATDRWGNRYKTAMPVRER